MNENKPLARAIRRNARERLRASTNLWKDYKRMRRGRWRRLSLGRWFVMLYPVFIIGVLGQRATNDLLLLLLTLYCTATIFGRSTGLATTLYRSGDLAFFMHVPVTDREFFDFEWPRFLYSSLFVWFCSATVFVVLTLRQEGPYGANLAAAAVAATLQWLLVLVLCIVLHLAPARFLNMRIGTPLYVLGFTAIFLPAQWVENLRWIAQPLPTAWVLRVFERGVLKHDTSTLPWVIASVVLVGLLPIAFQRMRNAYPRFELVYPLLTARVGVAEEVPRPKSARVVGESVESGSDKTAPAIALTPVLLPALNWENSGWIERLASRWLNSRDRQVATFLCGGKLGRWSAEWNLGIKIAAGGVVSMFLTSLLPGWVCLALGAVASVSALPVFGGRWDGLQLVAVSGTVGPAHAGLPLSYSEITRVLLKVNLVRYLVWVPIFLVYATAVAVVGGMPWSWGLQMGVGILIALISAQWIFVFGHLASGTNDTKRATLHTLGTFTAILVIAPAYLGCVAVFFVAMNWAPDPRAAWAAPAALGMFFFSWLIWRVYKLLYDRGRIDLMRLPN